MCDDFTAADDAELTAQSAVSRRTFTAMAGAATMVGMPVSATPATKPISEADVSITTPDGVADCYFVHPAKGRHPAVLIWPDIRGLRPVFREMAKRLAGNGYAVLIINPFYRMAKAPVVPAGSDFQDPSVRAKLWPMAQALTPERTVTDATALIAWLDKQKAVDVRRKMATTGYCMGGAMVIRTAAAFPARVGAGASFHGGGLATDKPDSPHLLAPKIRAGLLVAVAVNDDARDPGEKDRLRAALDAAKVAAEIEVYSGMHGWCVADGAAYNQAQAEKAWARMLALFNARLR